MSALSSQESEDLKSVSKNKGIPSNTLLNKMHIVGRFYGKTFQEYPYTETLLQSTSENFQKSMSSQEVFHVRTSVLQENIKESKEDVVLCGKNTQEQSTNANQDTQSSKTVLSLHQEDSKQSYKIFPKCGMMQNGVVYRLPGLVISRKENECSLLPTCRCSDSFTPGMIRVTARASKDSSRRFQLREELLVIKKDYRNKYAPPNLYEIVMGFPIGWTELDAAGTLSFQKYRNGLQKDLKSLKKKE